MTNNTTISVDLGKDVTYELIVEYLGGYEKAKLRLISTDKRLGYTHLYLHEGRYCFLDDYVDYIPDYALSIKSALNALLDYRRAHNIFEIGDQIVSTLKDDDFWMQCVCTIEAFHKKMAITNGAGHTIHHYEYRHITNAEREAGRRLDQ